MPNKLARRAIDTSLTVQPTILLHSSTADNTSTEYSATQWDTEGQDRRYPIIKRIGTVVKHCSTMRLLERSEIQESRSEIVKLK